MIFLGTGIDELVLRRTFSRGPDKSKDSASFSEGGIISSSVKPAMTCLRCAPIFNRN